MSEEPQDALYSVYGFADATAAFHARHPHWNPVLAHLEVAINLSFTRIEEKSDPLTKFVYFYGRLVAEDFMELFLMAVNGYGFGAMKLLRSMYEHTVTLKYLNENPNELQAFFDFDGVQQYKLMKQIIDTFEVGTLSPEIVAEVERDYEAVKNRFMVKSCKSKACTEQRIGHTWSKLDFVSMAKKTGAIGELIVPAYFFPLRHAHSTLRSMSERLSMAADRVTFCRESQPKEADMALMNAHNCLLLALEIQQERFEISGMREALETCLNDWRLAWSPDLDGLQ
jgi:hypothetical protein